MPRAHQKTRCVPTKIPGGHEYATCLPNKGRLPVKMPGGHQIKRWVPTCGIIIKIEVLHLKIKVYMKNVAVFTH